jgi:zinc D-Ala-D-Ala carboxypeptidase
MNPQVLDFPSVNKIPAGLWIWPNFTPEEFACKRTGRVLVNIAFMNRLQSLRNQFNAIMPVTSGFRDPSRGPNSAHALGRAADIHVIGTEAYRLAHLAMIAGFTGIGIGQMLGTEPLARFVHLDDMHTRPQIGAPRPAIWSYDQTARLRK